jgi:hypothetical protein
VPVWVRVWIWVVVRVRLRVTVRMHVCMLKANSRRNSPQEKHRVSVESTVDKNRALVFGLKTRTAPQVRPVLRG